MGLQPDDGPAARVSGGGPADHVGEIVGLPYGEGQVDSFRRPDDGGLEFRLRPRRNVPFGERVGPDPPALDPQSSQRLVDPGRPILRQQIAHGIQRPVATLQRVATGSVRMPYAT